MISQTLESGCTPPPSFLFHIDFHVLLAFFFFFITVAVETSASQKYDVIECSVT